MAPLNPLSGTEIMEDLGYTVRWTTVGDDHRAVEFHVDLQLAQSVVITITPDGRLVFSPEPVRGFTSAPNLRKAVALLTWCYRTAYREVFRLQNVDQLLFM